MPARFHQLGFQRPRHGRRIRLQAFGALFGTGERFAGCREGGGMLVLEQLASVLRGRQTTLEVLPRRLERLKRRAVGNLAVGQL